MYKVLRTSLVRSQDIPDNPEHSDSPPQTTEIMNSLVRSEDTADVPEYGNSPP